MDWNAPTPESATFTFDPMHWPYPMCPLTGSALNAAFATGLTTAARELKSPLDRVMAMSRNHYHYECFVMHRPASEEEARKAGELAEATIKPEMGRLLERWTEEHLPAIRKHLDRLRALDVEGMPAAEVPAAIDEVVAIQSDLWTIHFRIAFPMLLTLQIFDEFYGEVFGGEEGDGHALLVGVESESVKAGMGLYDLALRAKALGLEETFKSTPSHELLTALDRSDAGQTFMKELRAYLETYGLRQDLFDLGTPTWQEDPSFALSTIRNYIQSGRDARAEYAAMRQASEDALVAARAQLASYPEAVRGQFEGMLQMGRAGSFMQEEHNFYIDQQGLALTRLVFLKIGRRLAKAGLLDRPDDVFMLEVDDLKNLFAGPNPESRASEVRALVSRRQGEVEQARKMIPPPFIGPPPEGPPPADNPFARALGRFFGGPPQQAEHSNELKGNAGSRGTATGPAFVARTLEEANGLKPGDILVAVTTMPAWTPLFGVAAAVVTETGGPLSHCAIVAREYGIPAVVGAHGATHRIQTGQHITVDGAAGIVTIGDRD
jgi:pyruvate,water dikinase